MTRQTFKTNYLKTIDWLNGDIVDWVSAGQLYSAEGQQRQIAKYHYAFGFDTSITSENGQYAFIYKGLGTKRILLKEGEYLSLIFFMSSIIAPMIIKLNLMVFAFINCDGFLVKILFAKEYARVCLK